MACYCHLVAANNHVGQGQASLCSSFRVFQKQGDRATSVTRHPGLAFASPHLGPGCLICVDRNRLAWKGIHSLNKHRGGLGLLWVQLGGTWGVAIRTRPTHSQRVSVYLSKGVVRWWSLPTLPSLGTLGPSAHPSDVCHPFSLSVSAPLSSPLLLLLSLSLGSFLQGVYG